jgi:hypothetical protein
VPDTSAYGETITPTATQKFISSFTFELNAQGGSTAQYQAYVYQWNNSTSTHYRSGTFQLAGHDRAERK